MDKKKLTNHLTSLLLKNIVVHHTKKDVDIDAAIKAVTLFVETLEQEVNKEMDELAISLRGEFAEDLAELRAQLPAYL